MSVFVTSRDKSPLSELSANLPIISNELRTDTLAPDAAPAALAALSPGPQASTLAGLRPPSPNIPAATSPKIPEAPIDSDSPWAQLQAMREVLRAVVSDPQSALQRVMNSFTTHEEQVSHPEELQRLDSLKRYSLPLCLKKEHDLNRYFSPAEIAALSQISMSLEELLGSFGADRADLRGSAARAIANPKSAYNDVDFSLVIGQPWSQAEDRVRRTFAESVLAKAQLPKLSKSDRGRAAALFDAYLFDARVISSEGNQLFKLRMNRPPQNRQYRGQGAPVLAVDITIKPPQWRPAVFDSLESAYAIFNILGQRPRHAGPPVELIQWLHANNVRYFAESMLNGFERMIRARCKAPFSLLQPQLARRYYAAAGDDERITALTHLLMSDLYLQRRALAMYQGDDKTFWLTPLKQSFAEQLRTFSLDEGSIDDVVDAYLQAAAPTADERLNSAYWGAQQVARRHIAAMCEKLAQFIVRHKTIEAQQYFVDEIFPAVRVCDVLAMWQELEEESESVLVLAKRTLMLPALYHFGFTSEDEQDTHAGDKAAIIIAQQNAAFPSHLADRCISAARSAAPIWQRCDVVLPPLLEQCDINNRFRIARAWLMLCPKSTQAQKSYFHPDLAAQFVTENTSHDNLQQVAEYFFESGKRASSDEARRIISAALRQYFIGLRNPQHPQLIAILEQLTAAQPDVTEWKLQLILLRGYSAVYDHRDSDALAAANEALILEPEHSDALMMRAGVYYRDKNYLLARADLEKVSSTSSVPRLALGHCYFDMEDYERALAVYSEEERCQPGTEALRRILAIIHLKLKNDTLALQYIRHEDFVKAPQLAHELILELPRILEAKASRPLREKYSAHAVASALYLAENDADFSHYGPHQDIVAAYLPISMIVEQLAEKFRGSANILILDTILQLLSTLLSKAGATQGEREWIAQQALNLVQMVTPRTEFKNAELCRVTELIRKLQHVYGKTSGLPSSESKVQETLQKWRPLLLKLVDIYADLPVSDDPDYAAAWRALAGMLFKITSVATAHAGIRCLNQGQSQQSVEEAKAVLRASATLSLQRVFQEIAHSEPTAHTAMRTALFLLLELRRYATKIVDYAQSALRDSEERHPRIILSQMSADEKRSVIGARVELTKRLRAAEADLQQVTHFLLALGDSAYIDASASADSFMKLPNQHLLVLVGHTLDTLAQPDPDNIALLHGLLDAARDGIESLGTQVPHRHGEPCTVSLLSMFMDVYWNGNAELVAHADRNFPTVTLATKEFAFARLMTHAAQYSNAHVAKVIRFAVRHNLCSIAERGAESRERAPNTPIRLRDMYAALEMSKERTREVIAALRSTCTHKQITASIIREIDG